MARRHVFITKRSGQGMAWSSIMGDNAPSCIELGIVTSTKLLGLTTNVGLLLGLISCFITSFIAGWSTRAAPAGCGDGPQKGDMLLLVSRSSWGCQLENTMKLGREGDFFLNPTVQICVLRLRCKDNSYSTTVYWWFRQQIFSVKSGLIREPGTRNKFHIIWWQIWQWRWCNMRKAKAVLGHLLTANLIIHL